MTALPTEFVHIRVNSSPIHLKPNARAQAHYSNLASWLKQHELWQAVQLRVHEAFNGDQWVKSFSVQIDAEIGCDYWKELVQWLVDFSPHVSRVAVLGAEADYGNAYPVSVSLNIGDAEEMNAYRRKLAVDDLWRTISKNREMDEPGLKLLRDRITQELLVRATQST